MEYEAIGWTTTRTPSGDCADPPITTTTKIEVTGWGPVFAPLLEVPRHSRRCRVSRGRTTVVLR